MMCREKMDKKGLRRLLKLNDISIVEIDKYLNLSGNASLDYILNDTPYPIPTNLNRKIEDFLQTNNIDYNDNDLYIPGSGGVSIARGQIPAKEFDYKMIKTIAKELGWNMASLGCFLIIDKNADKAAVDGYISTMFKNERLLTRRQVEILAGLLETSTLQIKCKKKILDQKECDILEFDGKSMTQDKYNMSNFINTLSADEQNHLRKYVKCSVKFWNQMKSGMVINNYFANRLILMANELFGTTFSVEEAAEIKQPPYMNKELANPETYHSRKMEVKDGEEWKPGKKKPVPKEFYTLYPKYKKGEINKKEFATQINRAISTLERMIKEYEACVDNIATRIKQAPKVKLVELLDKKPVVEEIVEVDENKSDPEVDLDFDKIEEKFDQATAETVEDVEDIELDFIDISDKISNMSKKDRRDMVMLSLTRFTLDFTPDEMMLLSEYCASLSKVRECEGRLNNI